VEHDVPGILVDTDREGYEAVEKRSSQGEVIQIALHETDGISEGENGLPVYRLGQIDPHRVYVEPEPVRAYPLRLQVHEIRQPCIREECREVVIVQKKEVVGVGDEGKIVCVEIVPKGNGRPIHGVPHTQFSKTSTEVRHLVPEVVDRAGDSEIFVDSQVESTRKTQIYREGEILLDRV